MALWISLSRKLYIPFFCTALICGQKRSIEMARTDSLSQAVMTWLLIDTCAALLLGFDTSRPIARVFCFCTVLADTLCWNEATGGPNCGVDESEPATLLLISKVYRPSERVHTALLKVSELNLRAMSEKATCCSTLASGRTATPVAGPVPRSVTKYSRQAAVCLTRRVLVGLY
jgi:hypothetical protein